MRLLLDEPVPAQLRSRLVGHDARDEFDAFITLDQNLEFQQNIAERSPKT